MRIAALSDQHGYLPAIPPCDLLVIAGDVCPDLPPDHQAAWFGAVFRPWLAASAPPRTILTWGNHDLCAAQSPGIGAGSRYGAAGRLDVVVDGIVNIEGLAIWATPWSNTFEHWAFMKSPENLALTYRAIPDGLDVLVSHQPPYGYGDEQLAAEVGGLAHLGSRELLRAIDRARPRLVICGHIHSGHGRYLHNGIPILNVSVVDQEYQLAHPVTTFDLPDRG